MKNYLQILRETLKAMLSKPMWLMVVASCASPRCRT